MKSVYHRLCNLLLLGAKLFDYLSKSKGNWEKPYNTSNFSWGRLKICTETATHYYYLDVEVPLMAGEC